MKIFFDTNVLVSAFMTSGSCRDIVMHAIHNHEPYYSAFIMNEFKRTFKNTFNFSDSVIQQFVSFITSNFIEGNTAKSIEKVCKDSDDDQVLADAVYNNVDVIMTGDKLLLEIHTYQNVAIIPPREYWNL
jgi:putative PIN family toxin of toxin-antitoxin system